ncbi:hypothetical protein E2C01_067822 [Portunus trituberculatus]|uniref:Uncharacterized protein n=1 Tax=Portunus trituberculatus TaxID=210409 RepID=A0A5B7HM33_PORTR|nr:hypothetical protein [Portunus trituberculatus]
MNELTVVLNHVTPEPPSLASPPSNTPSPHSPLNLHHSLSSPPPLVPHHVAKSQHSTVSRRFRPLTPSPHSDNLRGRVRGAGHCVGVMLHSYRDLRSYSRLPIPRHPQRPPTQTLLSERRGERGLKG